MGVAVRGVGKALPSRVVTNDEIGERLGVDADWIEQRTGIKQRRFADPSDSASSLGTQAAKQALERSGIDGDEIDLIVVATCTPDHIFPSTASLIQEAVGASKAAAFDVSAACAGFVYALSVAAQMLEGGSSKALVIGSDLLTRHLQLDDPQTAPLFGDGAGAFVMEHDPSTPPMRFLLGSDGGGAEHISIPAGGSRMPATFDTLANGLHCIKMSGREVYRSAVRTMSQLGVELGADGFDLIVAHQANRRILEECAAQIGADIEKVYMNVERYGNTSAASIPIAVCEAWETGRLDLGDRLVLLAFGAGYAWGGAKLTWTTASPRVLVEESVTGGVS